ncbi:50S ribosomal protein L25/general stress protein Ctc [Varibaculum vaginae]|uniref:50S ribosomal protein L25/general stress protein Ctc n=1 Tax=Varibaculum vaginae TaxID=2364797 RepID=UPI000F07603B|nr:50S ribosomal protein L25/general stress protein Ctc [Varibaculum vaginae]
MAAELSAQLRSETGKGAARRARRAGLIPAVLYGHTVEENLNLNLPGHDTFLIVKDNPNAIINLDVEGEKHLVLLKEIQRHPVRRDILHIDLLAVSRDEKVEVEVPVSVVGESAPGTVVNLEIFDLPVQVSPLEIPEEIVINVEGWEEGRVLRASELELPAGVVTTLEDEHDVLSITLPEEMPEEPAAEEAEQGEDASQAETKETSEE